MLSFSLSSFPSPFLSVSLARAALLSALNEFYSYVGGESHDKCDERIKRKTSHSFSSARSSSSFTSLHLSPSFSLSLLVSVSLQLSFFRCTKEHIDCSKLSIRHGVRHCRSCLAISQQRSFTLSHPHCVPFSYSLTLLLAVCSQTSQLALIVVIKKFAALLSWHSKRFSFFKFRSASVSLSVCPLSCLSICLSLRWRLRFS